MMRASTSLLLAVVMVSLLPATPEALAEQFYKNTCPNVDTIVSKAISAAFATDQGVAPALVRLHFHDCFVRGCDASVLLDGSNSEKTAVPNLSLREVAFKAVDDAKAALEAACPGVVSCADVLAYAARDSAVLSGNITWKVLGGRRDGSTSLASEASANLPSPFWNASRLISNFATKNLTADELVTLSGAHSIGVAHCATFSNRLYNFSATSDIDPTLSSAYASLLRRLCPQVNPPATATADLDIVTPNVLDNRYYVALQNNIGLLTSDAALVTDATLAASVKDNAENVNGFANRFMRAMVKMGNTGVLEGTQGQIRKNCRVVNAKSSLRGGSFAAHDSALASQ